MSSRILAILNHKGGVGKTTTCFNLASAYADQGLRILAVDLDPQSHPSVSLGKKQEGLTGIDDIILEQSKANRHIIQSP